MRSSARLLSPRAVSTVDSLVILSALLFAICAAENVNILTHGFAIFAARVTLSNVFKAALVFGLWTTAARRLRLYSPDINGGFHEVSRLLLAVAAATGGLVLTLVAEHKVPGAIEMGFWFGGYSSAAMLLMRSLVALISGDTAAERDTRTVLIVGTGPRAVKIYRELRTERFRSHKLLGFVDSRPVEACPHEIGELYLGSVTQLEKLVLQHVVDEVLIALPGRSCYADIERTVTICNRAGVEVKCPQDIHPGWEFHHRSAATPTSFLSNRPPVSDSRLFVKRCIDVACSLAALVFLSPVMLAISLAVKLTTTGPVFFKQERYGFGRRRFYMYKFRSMVADAEALIKAIEDQNEASGPIFKMRNDPRVTTVGRWLRRTSLDELPQLLNVLKGDMSLVGPRPMSVRDVSQFNESWLMRRFSVKPGLTCLWQINGRSSTTFRRWMELDMRYIDTWSLRLDAQILAATIPAVVKGRGAM